MKNSTGDKSCLAFKANILMAQSANILNWLSFDKK